MITANERLQNHMQNMSEYVTYWPVLLKKIKFINNELYKGRIIKFIDVRRKEKPRKC